MDVALALPWLPFRKIATQPPPCPLRAPSCGGLGGREPASHTRNNTTLTLCTSRGCCMGGMGVEGDRGLLPSSGKPSCFCRCGCLRSNSPVLPIFSTALHPPPPDAPLPSPHRPSLDTSEWMRNGDYAPTRLEAQQDAGERTAVTTKPNGFCFCCFPPHTTVGLLPSVCLANAECPLSALSHPPLLFCVVLSSSWLQSIWCAGASCGTTQRALWAS